MASEPLTPERLAELRALVRGGAYCFPDRAVVSAVPALLDEVQLLRDEAEAKITAWEEDDGPEERCGLLGQECRSVRLSEDWLREALAASDAVAAALRTALEVIADACGPLMDDPATARPTWNDMRSRLVSVVARAEAALSGDAGRALAERVRLLEAFVAAIDVAIGDSDEEATECEAMIIAARATLGEKP